MRRTRFGHLLALALVVGWLAPLANAQETKSARGTVTALGPSSITRQGRRSRPHPRRRSEDRADRFGCGHRRPGGRSRRQGRAKALRLRQGRRRRLGQLHRGRRRDARGAHPEDQLGGIGRRRSSTEAQATTQNGTVTSIDGSTLTISGSGGGGSTFTQSYTVNRETKVVAAGAGTAAAAGGGGVAITSVVGVGDQVRSPTGRRARRCTPSRCASPRRRSSPTTAGRLDRARPLSDHATASRMTRGGAAARASRRGAGRWSSQNDSTAWWRSSAACTMPRWTPRPRPWTSRTSVNPAACAARRDIRRRRPGCRAAGMRAGRVSRSIGMATGSSASLAMTLAILRCPFGCPFWAHGYRGAAPGAASRRHPAIIGPVGLSGTGGWRIGAGSGSVPGVSGMSSPSGFFGRGRDRARVAEAAWSAVDRRRSASEPRR